jgi:heme exporter protein CcmD
MSFWEFANPRKFMGISERLSPWLFALAGLCLVVGLVWGFFFTPDDFRQGSTVKIIYLHVPSAMMAINAWAMMLVASLIWLIRRHHVSALAARAAAPVGVTMTLIALFTGAIWGQPMWGTWWAWDPRLTSFLILFLFYLGYMALWAAIEDPGHGSGPHLGPLPRGVGVRDPVPLCGELLEPGAAPGGDAVARQGGEHRGRLLVSAARLHRGIRAPVPGAGVLPDGDRDPVAPAPCHWPKGADGMMPDLGKYAVEVLSAYGVSILLLAGIVGLSVARARRVRRELDEAEARHRRG